jgi:hypothetical protein
VAKDHFLVGSAGHDSEVEIAKDGHHEALGIEIEDRCRERSDLNVTINDPVDRVILLGQKRNMLCGSQAKLDLNPLGDQQVI